MLQTHTHTHNYYHLTDGFQSYISQIQYVAPFPCPFQRRHGPPFPDVRVAETSDTARLQWCVDIIIAQHDLIKIRAHTSPLAPSSPLSCSCLINIPPNHPFRYGGSLQIRACDVLFKSLWTPPLHILLNEICVFWAVAKHTQRFSFLLKSGSI